MLHAFAVLVQVILPGRFPSDRLDQFEHGLAGLEERQLRAAVRRFAAIDHRNLASGKRGVDLAASYAEHAGPALAARFDVLADDGHLDDLAHPRVDIRLPVLAHCSKRNCGGERRHGNKVRIGR